MEPHYSYTDLDTISYISALVFSGKKLVHVYQSWGQTACLMAALQKKITYRSALFPFDGGGAKDALQKKLLEEPQVKW